MGCRLTMDKLKRLFDESSTKDDIITICATVDTGFEWQAIDEHREKISSSQEAIKERGRIYFNIHWDQYQKVEELRSIDNIFIVADVRNIAFDGTKNTDLQLFKDVVQNHMSLNKGLDIWKQAACFMGELYPTMEQYNSIKKQAFVTKEKGKKEEKNKDENNENEEEKKMKMDEKDKDKDKEKEEKKNKEIEVEDKDKNKEKEKDEEVKIEEEKKGKDKEKEEKKNKEIEVEEEKKEDQNKEIELEEEKDKEKEEEQNKKIEVEEEKDKEKEEEQNKEIEAEKEVEEEKDKDKKKEGEQNKEIEVEEKKDTDKDKEKNKEIEVKEEKDKDKEKEEEQNKEVEVEEEKEEEKNKEIEVEEEKDKDKEKEGEQNEEIKVEEEKDKDKDNEKEGEKAKETKEKKKKDDKRRKEKDKKRNKGKGQGEETKNTRGRRRGIDPSESKEGDIVRYRVTCERSGEHSFESTDVACIIGGELQTKYHWIVNLSKYHLEVICKLTEQQLVTLLRVTHESKHRRNIVSFGPTTLRSTICYNLLRLADPKPGDIIIDPMCGSGSIPIEAALAFSNLCILCGDKNSTALDKTKSNIDGSETKARVNPIQWMALNLPLKDSFVDIIVTDMPFGKRSGRKVDNDRLYKQFLVELGRVVKTFGRLILLTHDKRSFNQALRTAGDMYVLLRAVSVKIGGLEAIAYVLKRTRVHYTSYSPKHYY